MSLGRPTRVRNAAPNDRIRAESDYGDQLMNRGCEKGPVFDDETSYRHPFELLRPAPPTFL